MAYKALSFEQKIYFTSCECLLESVRPWGGHANYFPLWRQRFLFSRHVLFVVFGAGVHLRESHTHTRLMVGVMLAACGKW